MQLGVPTTSFLVFCACEVTYEVDCGLVVMRMYICVRLDVSCIRFLELHAFDSTSTVSI